MYNQKAKGKGSISGYLWLVGWLFILQLSRRVEWIQLAQDRDQWEALVNTVMNLWVLAPWS
jgi:hypothetical protein